MTEEQHNLEHKDLASFLDEVREIMADTLRSTTLGFLADQAELVLGQGKMLRSRLAYRLGVPQGVSTATLAKASAAVELIHAASLLHDDVIDGGTLRRGAPAFWVEKGVAGAILLGDLLLFKAIDLICQVENGSLTHELVKLTGEVCEAESEQELVFQGVDSELQRCISIARRKTGALFAFAGYASANGDPALQSALKEMGYLVGTAYQLADDILDATGTVEVSGKTLGTDQRRDIVSAASLGTGKEEDPLAAIEALIAKGRDSVAHHPSAAQAYETYIQLDIQPSLDKILANARSD